MVHGWTVVLPCGWKHDRHCNENTARLKRTRGRVSGGHGTGGDGRRRARGRGHRGRERRRAAETAGEAQRALEGWCFSV